MQSLTLYVDGAARGNPGPAGIGAVIIDEDENVQAEIHEYIGETTNNVAEYQALIRGLKEAEHFAPDGIKVYSDSQLLVRQITGAYRVKHPNLIPLYREAVALIRSFPNFRIDHIPRQKNKRADKLANQGIDDKLGDKK
ncbi:MAG: ribonuclease HI family protein [Firmicutes bacterium]|nr:ribonuclease HI family protein [Bacillota bacterium]